MEILIKHGGNLEAKYGAAQFTPLHIATEKGQAEIVQMLISKGCQNQFKIFNWCDTYLAGCFSWSEFDSRYFATKWRKY